MIKNIVFILLLGSVMLISCALALAILYSHYDLPPGIDDWEREVNYGDKTLDINLIPSDKRDGRREVVLGSDVVFSVLSPSSDGSLRSALVPISRGFVSDFASIPWPFNHVISPFGDHAEAAIIHDWLYAVGAQAAPSKDARRVADWVFYDVMREQGVHWLRRRIMYVAVRLGGAEAFGRQEEWNTNFYDPELGVRLPPECVIEFPVFMVLQGFDHDTGGFSDVLVFESNEIMSGDDLYAAYSEFTSEYRNNWFFDTPYRPTGLQAYREIFDELSPIHRLPHNNRPLLFEGITAALVLGTDDDFFSRRWHTAYSSRPCSEFILASAAEAARLPFERDVRLASQAGRFAGAHEGEQSTNDSSHAPPLNYLQLFVDQVAPDTPASAVVRAHLCQEGATTCEENGFLPTHEIERINRCEAINRRTDTFKISCGDPSRIVISPRHSPAPVRSMFLDNEEQALVGVLGFSSYCEEKTLANYTYCEIRWRGEPVSADNLESRQADLILIRWYDQQVSFLATSHRISGYEGSRIQVLTDSGQSLDFPEECGYARTCLLSESFTSELLIFLSRSDRITLNITNEQGDSVETHVSLIDFASAVSKINP